MRPPRLRYEAYSQRLAAALTQQPGSPVPLEELVVILFAVQTGLVDSAQPSGVAALLQKGLDWLRQHNPQVRGASIATGCLQGRHCVCGQLSWRAWQANRCGVPMAVEAV
jgi:hypothetical protein